MRSRRPARRDARPRFARDGLAPVWVDALDLRAEIDHAVRAWEPSGVSTSHRLRRLAARRWRRQDVAVLERIELSQHETSLLLQTCRTVDTLDHLQVRLDASGPIIDSPQGLKAHPAAAAAELRQQRIALARPVAALGLPTGVSEDDQATQRRSVRGVYQPNVGAK